MSSPRVYVRGVNYDGTEEFLHTFFDKRGCVSYIDKHKKIFPYRFKYYIFGQMCDEKNTWEVVG